MDRARQRALGIKIAGDLGVSLEVRKQGKIGSPPHHARDSRVTSRQFSVVCVGG